MCVFRLGFFRLEILSSFYLILSFTSCKLTQNSPLGKLIKLLYCIVLYCIVCNFMIKLSSLIDLRELRASFDNSSRISANVVSTSCLALSLAFRVSLILALSITFKFSISFTGNFCQNRGLCH